MPARRVIVSPQGGGPLTFVGGTLPPAIMGVLYSQNVTTRANSGSPPYAFSLVSQVGPDTFSVIGPVISGTPVSPSVQITDLGEYIITETGDIQVT